MMSYVISARGHLCTAVESVNDAFAVLDDFRADAVVYDWNRRVGTLLGFGREVRARFSSVRGVVVTSTVDEPPHFQADEALDGYFTKPVAMGEVVTRVELVVRSRRG